MKIVKRCFKNEMKISKKTKQKINKTNKQTKKQRKNNSSSSRVLVNQVDSAYGDFSWKNYEVPRMVLHSVIYYFLY